jgi:hypothetical protein
MQRKNKVLLSAILLLSLGAILVVAILIALNQPGTPEKISDTGLVSSLETQIVYPAPNPTIAAQAANEQAVYPPPSTEAMLPTNTAIPIKADASPIAEQGILTAENVQRTSLQDAKVASEGKTAIFLDVRTSESYALNHVPGAISIPEAQIIKRMKELDPNQWIIAYCS